MTATDSALFLSYGVLWLIVIVQSLVLIECLRQIGIFKVRLGNEPGAMIVPEALDRGTAAPAFAVVDARTGRTVTQDSLKGGRSLALFLSPTCSPCRTLAAELPRFMHYYPKLNVVAFCSGPDAACRAFADEFRLPFPVLVDGAQAITRAYGASRTPHAVVFDEEARVLIQGVPADWKQLEQLLDEEGTPMGNRDWLLQESTSGSVQDAAIARIRD